MLTPTRELLHSLLKRTVPENRHGSCGIIDTRERRFLSEIVAMSTPSIVIEPEAAGTIRNSANLCSAVRRQKTKELGEMWALRAAHHAGFA